jgi:hypothetical protein
VELRQTLVFHFQFSFSSPYEGYRYFAASQGLNGSMCAAQKDDRYFVQLDKYANALSVWDV